MADTTLTIAFTGHRPKDLFGYADRARWSELKMHTMDAIKAVMAEHGTASARIITGGAQGVDQIAFWAAETLKRDKSLTIENVLYKPFDGQEGRWQETGLFGKDEFHLMCDMADRVHLTDHDLSDSASVPAKLMHRNCAMVDDADVLIAVMREGYDIDGRGGTAHAARYARKRGIECHRLVPETGKLIFNVFSQA